MTHAEAMARLTYRRPGGVEAALLETRWVLYRQGPRATVPKIESSFEPGAAALIGFRDACERGKPGRYELRGSAARRTLVLARAVVEGDQMVVMWHAPNILFALGAKGMYEALPGVVAYLRGVGALPKEEA